MQGRLTTNGWGVHVAYFMCKVVRGASCHKWVVCGKGNWLRMSSAIVVYLYSTVSHQPCENGVLGVVFWVWGIARSHTEPNQANMVFVERYALSFWRDGHEERVQCETANYRDEKTTSCLPKISFDGRPGRSKSSTRSLPSLKSLYHL